MPIVALSMHNVYLDSRPGVRVPLRPVIADLSHNGITGFDHIPRFARC